MWWAAASAWAGAVLAVPVPLWTGPVTGLLAARLGGIARLVVACIGIGLLASSLGSRALDGLQPVERGDHRGEVTLLSDPRWYGPSLRMDVRIRDRRIEAWARGSDAARLAERLAGERVVVAGRLAPPPDDAPWLAARHVVGRMSVDEVGPWRPGGPASRLANGMRRALMSGASSMAERDRGLFLGLLLGDRRDHDPILEDAFDGSGLTHLMAVSGSNVAFVMALAGPMLRRLRFGRRLVASVALLAFFALLTRFEPSVLRATTMAGLGAVAVTFGWEAESRRILAATVAVLVLVDPLLTRSIGFQLSVAASAGILLWSRRLARGLPGPRVLAEPLAVTVTAQLAVAPLLIPAFGGLPVAALPANLLASPATGPVVVWGLPAGLAAGMLGEPFASVLHLPTELCVGWIGAVAEHTSTWRLGEIATGHLVVALTGVGAIALARHLPGEWALRASGAVLIAGSLLQPAWALRAGDSSGADLGPAAQLHTDGNAVVLELDSGARVSAVLEGLRRAGVERIDVVVAHHGGRRVAEVVAALGKRSPPRLVLVPEEHRVPGGAVPDAPSEMPVGDLLIEISQVAPRLEATVRARGGAGAARRARAPPR